MTFKIKHLIFILIFSGSFFSISAQSYDICIYGATSAGVIASYTAKQQGKSVILLELSGHIGGLSSGGLGQTDIGNKIAITGLARDFYRRIGKHYGKFEKWTFEPSVASKIFDQYLKESRVPVLLNHQLLSLKKSNSEIKEIRILDFKTKKQKIIKAKIFIDATYEGDLMAMAGVSYAVGRESNEMYQENHNGYQLKDKHQFPDNIDPYIIKGDIKSGLLWGVSNNNIRESGTGDKYLQAYNFRLCLTDSVNNQVAIEKPDNYDLSKYELLLRYIEAKKPKELNWHLMHIQPMPNRKTDINNSGPFSTDMIGENYNYADATNTERLIIQKKHEDYIKGLLYFLGHDARVPTHLRMEMLKYGYPKDEFRKTNNFSPQMYIREARRMISDYVMTEKNCVGTESVKDGVGLAAYTMDSHNCQRLVVNGMVKNEGDVQEGLGGLPPYPISYRSIIPKKSECNNLIVPVCLSASHIAYGSIRMEPVFMVLAQSAATAAVQAINSRQKLHEIDINTLQKELKSNPLVNNSFSEILIDNNLKNNNKIGSWISKPKGFGRYGLDFEEIDLGTQPEAIFTFDLSQQKTQRVKIMAYIPANEELANDFTYTFKRNNLEFPVNIKPSKDESDWYEIGEFKINSNSSLSLSSKNKKGKLIADAVILIPKK